MVIEVAPHIVKGQVSCQPSALAPAVCEASPTEGDVPDVRRERLLFNRQYSTMPKKNRRSAVKKQRNPRRSLALLPSTRDLFSFGYFSFWASKKKSNNAGQMSQC
jgi:hypothetical protein